MQSIYRSIYRDQPRSAIRLPLAVEMHFEVRSEAGKGGSIENAWAEAVPSNRARGAAEEKRGSLRKEQESFGQHMSEEV